MSINMCCNTEREWMRNKLYTMYESTVFAFNVLLDKVNINN